MTDSNRLQLASTKEATLGVTPASPRMRKARITSESLSFQPQSVTSEELRDDRMNPDPIKIGETNQGAVSFEMSYPPPNSPMSDWLESVFFSPWGQMPERDNDGVADSAITSVDATTDTVTVAAGAAFAVGHLVRHTGFGAAANNGLFPVTTGGATSYVSAGAALADEVAPAATARAKVVGAQGASGDIVAVADGLTSTALDFTTLGLRVGQPIKIGGAGSAYRFAAEAANGWARVVGIDPGKLTLDTLPSGWAADAGTGKTIRLFFGDTLRNGITMVSSTIERGFLGQAAPTYIAQRGMVADQLDLNFAAKEKLTGSITFMGMGGVDGATPLSATPDPAPDQAAYPVLAGSVNVGRLTEAGATITGPDWVRSLRLGVRNNCRLIEALDHMGAVDIGAGTQEVTAQVETYFGSRLLLSRVLAMQPTSVSIRVEKAGRALVLGLPRLVPMSGSPNAGGRNQDVMISIAMQASRDPLTGVQITLDRLEYVEA